MRCWKDKGWFTAHQQQEAETEAGVKAAAALSAASSLFVLTAPPASPLPPNWPSCSQVPILEPIFFQRCSSNSIIRKHAFRKMHTCHKDTAQ